MGYTVQKHCRACGKLYTPCANCENDNTAFHWRTVACSYECGMEYFKAVMKNREKESNKKNEENLSSQTKQENVKSRKRYIKKETSLGQ